MVSVASAMSAGSEADGEWLFSQLERISEIGVVSREDYYTDEAGWDLEGLRSDLRIHMNEMQ